MRALAAWAALTGIGVLAVIAGIELRDVWIPLGIKGEAPATVLVCDDAEFVLVIDPAIDEERRIARKEFKGAVRYWPHFNLELDRAAANNRGKSDIAPIWIGWSFRQRLGDVVNVMFNVGRAVPAIANLHIKDRDFFGGHGRSECHRGWRNEGAFALNERPYLNAGYEGEEASKSSYSVRLPVKPPSSRWLLIVAGILCLVSSLLVSNGRQLIWAEWLGLFGFCLSFLLGIAGLS